MKKLVKGIKAFIALFLFIIISSLIYYKGSILLVFDIYKELKDSNKSIETLGNLINYKASSSMEVKYLKYKNTASKEVFLDLYLSNNYNKPSPVIIYVHGGSWIYGDNSIPIGLEPIINAFNNRGFTIISLSYELLDSRNIDLKDPIIDVKDAIRWVYKNKDKYNFNTNDIGLLGISSGAQLSLMAAYTDDESFIGDKDLSNYSSKVNYVIDIFGPTELSTLDFSDISLNNKKIKNLINSKDELDNYSPINYISDESPKTLIVHSIEDEIVPYSNSEDLYNSLLSNNIDTNLITLKQGSHFFTDFNLNEVYIAIIKVLKFLTSSTSL
ncbi:prolyl oligopeptidase family serine peptidase [Clostridium tertium]|uniref:Acetyl esterase n=1 Tax=Clostridium tertium TaxID=1559 RepID=A0A6N2YKW9_9CLOT